jgi:hypothetical protein
VEESVNEMVCPEQVEEEETNAAFALVHEVTVSTAMRLHPESEETLSVTVNVPAVE